MTRYVLGGPIHPLVALLITAFVGLMFSVKTFFTHDPLTGFLVLIGGMVVSVCVYFIFELFETPRQ